MPKLAFKTVNSVRPRWIDKSGLRTGASPCQQRRVSQGQSLANVLSIGEKSRLERALPARPSRTKGAQSRARLAQKLRLFCLFINHPRRDHLHPPVVSPARISLFQSFGGTKSPVRGWKCDFGRSRRTGRACLKRRDFNSIDFPALLCCSAVLEWLH